MLAKRRLLHRAVVSSSCPVSSSLTRVCVLTAAWQLAARVRMVSVYMDADGLQPEHILVASRPRAHAGHDVRWHYKGSCIRAKHWCYTHFEPSTMPIDAFGGVTLPPAYVSSIQ